MIEETIEVILYVRVFERCSVRVVAQCRAGMAMAEPILGCNDPTLANQVRRDRMPEAVKAWVGDAGVGLDPGRTGDSTGLVLRTPSRRISSEQPVTAAVAGNSAK
jgi:hypothetical protein